MTLRAGSLFSGIGGMDLGFHQAGFEVAWQVEIDPQCRGVLKKWWPGVPCYVDVKEVTRERLVADLGARADVDVLIGGFPCQDVSLAGRREGLAGQRSGLFHEFMRVAEEFRPRWMVVENVPGLLSSWSPIESPPDGLQVGTEWDVEEGSDFDTVISALGDLGCGYAWRVLDAQFFGVPQRRRRVFFVSHLGRPWSAPAEVLLECEGVGGNPAEGTEEGEDDAPDSEEGTRDGRWHGREGRAGAGAATRIVSSLTSSQGGADDNDAQAGHLIAEVEGRLFVGNEFGDEAARTLLSSPGGQRWDLETENFVVEPETEKVRDTTARAVSMRGRKEGNVPEMEESDVCPTLRTGGGGSGNPMVLTHGVEGQAVAFNVHGEHSTAMTGGGDSDVAFPTEVSRCLDTTGTFATNQGGTVVVGPEAQTAVNQRDEAVDETSDQSTLGPIPIDIRSALRRSGATGVGTPGMGVGEPGDKAFTVTEVVQAVGAEVYRKVHRANHDEDPETWDQADVANTLNSFDTGGDVRSTHAVVEAFQCHGNNVGPMGTLRSGNGGLTGGVPFVPEAFSIYPESGQGADLAATPIDVATTVTAEGYARTTDRGTFIAQGEPLAFSSKDSGADASDVSPTLRAMNYDQSHLNGGGQVAVAQYLTVRRLTPMECERLQGFPDAWTAVGGGPQSDSVRYRQLGNAVAVPVAAWIARRLMNVHKAIYGGT